MDNTLLLLNITVWTIRVLMATFFMILSMQISTGLKNHMTLWASTTVACFVINIHKLKTLFPWLCIIMRATGTANIIWNTWDRLAGFSGFQDQVRQTPAGERGETKITFKKKCFENLQLALVLPHQDTSQYPCGHSFEQTARGWLPARPLKRSCTGNLLLSQFLDAHSDKHSEVSYLPGATVSISLFWLNIILFQKQSICPL